jgi:hypothetical protein
MWIEISSGASMMDIPMKIIQSHHRCRDGQPTLSRREQVLKLPIGKQNLAMIDQEREHAALSHQMTHQPCASNSSRSTPLHTPHQKIISAQANAHRTGRADYQQPPSQLEPPNAFDVAGLGSGAVNSQHARH